MEAACETCGLPFCARCLPCPNCVATPETTDGPDEEATPPTTPLESVADTGSTQESAQPPCLYEGLRDESLESFSVPGGLVVRRAIDLGSCTIEDEVGSRTFGTACDDFRRLCRNAACDFPGGLLLVNLDRWRSLVFTGESFFEAQIVDIHAGMSWMCRTPGTFGLTVQARAGQAICTLFAFVYYAEHARDHLRRRGRYLLQIVREWE